MINDNETLTPITFDRAKELVPDGVQNLVDIRCDLDDVDETYGSLYVENRYEFFQDTQARVWVMTDAPEEPGIWIPSIRMWLGVSECEEDIIEEIRDRMPANE